MEVAPVRKVPGRRNLWIILTPEQRLRVVEATTRLLRTAAVASFDDHIAMVAGGGALDARLLPDAGPVVFPAEDAAVAVVRYGAGGRDSGVAGTAGEPADTWSELAVGALWQRQLHC